MTADATGAVTLRATLGDHVAVWEDDGATVHARFRVERGAGPGVVAVAALP